MFVAGPYQERWNGDRTCPWFFLEIVIEIHSSEIVLEKPSAGFELKILGILITMKLGKVAHFKNNFLVNGSLNNCWSGFVGNFLRLHASISTDNNMTNANLINISIELI